MQIQIASSHCVEHESGVVFGATTLEVIDMPYDSLV